LSQLSLYYANFNRSLSPSDAERGTLFWFNALLIASNGTDSRVRSLTADWERFFEVLPHAAQAHRARGRAEPGVAGGNAARDVRPVAAARPDGELGTTMKLPKTKL